MKPTDWRIPKRRENPSHEWEQAGGDGHPDSCLFRLEFYHTALSFLVIRHHEGLPYLMDVMLVAGRERFRSCCHWGVEWTTLHASELVA